MTSTQTWNSERRSGKHSEVPMKHLPDNSKSGTFSTLSFRLTGTICIFVLYDLVERAVAFPTSSLACPVNNLPSLHSVLPLQIYTMPDLHPFGGRLSKHFSGSVWQTVSLIRCTYPPPPMAACLVRSASILGCSMSFAGRRSRRLGILREREEGLGADEVFEQLSPEGHYLSCKDPRVIRVLET